MTDFDWNCGRKVVGSNPTPAANDNKRHRVKSCVSFSISLSNL